MFCQYCGAQLPDDAAFCPNCGKPVAAKETTPASASTPCVENAYQSPLKQRVDVRVTESAELSKMMGYFSEKQDKYQKFDELVKKFAHIVASKRVPLLVWGIILLTMGFITLIAQFSDLARVVYGASGTYILNNKYMGIVLVLFNLVGAACMIAGFIINSVNRNRSFNNCLNELRDISKELYEHYDAYGTCIVSVEYTNPEVLGAILNTIESGKADTAKEALNILEAANQRRNAVERANLALVERESSSRGLKTIQFFGAKHFSI